ncbi:hypothetical protein BURMUCGD2M_2171 [Burkholderia multivorans CGD2M]|uniref:Uncharacterized protein n=1 Tax=Burkholderia multivorans CGD2 TaxID=513052 RepID=B9BML6_9BURK|nr:hypothetical protein BURMUCGD1_1713 [Burkholderia multivorans CGD1]EEE07876.1 hypothetical protein BURMUCGD2_2085 [Burkholderia multivorans CGD2]EEE14186.1 hypothetical protein BURMUCGD2M_2171 [Burkholderia multivorans CGD2M]
MTSGKARAIRVRAAFENAKKNPDDIRDIVGIERPLKKTGARKVRSSYMDESM